MEVVLADTGSNRSMVLSGYAHKSTPITDESVEGVGGRFKPERKAVIILPHPVVGSRIEACYEVGEDIMPKGCVAVLGTGACARMDIDTHKHCKLAIDPAKGLVE